MQAHNVGVELHQDRDATDNRLCGDTKTNEQGQPEEVPAVLAHPEDESKGCNRHNDKQEGQQAVSELDNAVNTHLGGVHQRIRRAGGPGGAAQTTGSEANSTTGDHNENLHNEGCPGRNPDLAINCGGEPIHKSAHDGEYSLR